MSKGLDLIGRTPSLPFAPRRKPIFLFEASGEIRFRQISTGERQSLTAHAAEGVLFAEQAA